MKLEEILKNRLKTLYKDLRRDERILQSNKGRLTGISDSIELLDLFLEDAVHIENIRNIDTSFITDLLLDYKYISDTSIESDLGIIKLLLKGIYDRGLKTSLNDEQKEMLSSYIDKATQLFNELTEKKSKLLEDYRSVNDERDRIEEEILRIEILLEKLKDEKDESILTMEDLKTIRLISDDKSVEAKTRKEVLIRFVEYNNERKQGVSKLNKTDVNEVIKIFNEYGRNLTRTINKYTSEVETNADINNIREILDYMVSVDILGRFQNAELLTICLYGNKESVESEYEEISKKDNDRLYYNIASAWINNVENRVVKKKRYYAHEKGDKQNTTLQYYAHQISREEIDKNIDYLKREGFEFDTDEPGVLKTITTNTYRLKEAVNSLKLYGVITEDNVSKFKVWLLSEPQVVEKLDRFVELGLLGGHEGHIEYANYLKRYPGKLHNTEYPVYLLLYKVKQTYGTDSYYDTIASSKSGQLAGDLNSGRLGAALYTPEDIEFYKKDNFVSPESRIENYLTYEDIINSNYNVEIKKEILKQPEIQNLEENHRVDDNPYVYVFDGLVISRLKVLRNYSLINDGTKASLMASIVKGSFLTEESFQKVAQDIDYTLGGQDGLLRRIQTN